MIDIIQEREDFYGEAHDLFYAHDERRTSGYSFECDENGVVDVEAKNPTARANYEKCLASGKTPEFRTWPTHWTTPRVGRCVCGKTLELMDFTNTCECGRDYNSSGAELAPRSQWGEETGETWRDCV